MKKITGIILAVLLLSTLCLPALADEDDHVIRVSGYATVTLPADYATIEIGVTTQKSTVGEAQEENNRLIEATLQAIYGAGVDKKDVTTSSFNVYSGYNYDEVGQGTRCFTIDNMLHVIVRDLDQLGEILDAAMNAGANNTYGINFSSERENDAYQLALTRAVEDAAQKATVLASATGKTLGDLILVEAKDNGYAYGVTNVYNETTADSAGTIVAGDVSVYANVVLEYTFK